MFETVLPHPRSAGVKSNRDARGTSKLSQSVLYSHLSSSSNNLLFNLTCAKALAHEPLTKPSSLSGPFQSTPEGFWYWLNRYSVKQLQHGLISCSRSGMKAVPLSSSWFQKSVCNANSLAFLRATAKKSQLGIVGLSSRF